MIPCELPSVSLIMFSLTMLRIKKKNTKKSQTRWGVLMVQWKPQQLKTSLKKVYLSGLRQKSSYPLARCKLKNTLQKWNIQMVKWVFDVSETCINRILSINSHPETSHVTMSGIVSIRRSFFLMPWLENRNWPRVDVPHLPLSLQAKPSNIRHHNLQKNRILWSQSW